MLLEQLANRIHAMLPGCHSTSNKKKKTKNDKRVMSERSSLAYRYPLNNPVHPHMLRESIRLASFRYNDQWQGNNIAATPQQMAKAGFFYMGNSDRVQCWYCNGALEGWEYDDDPWTEHAKWYPSCEFTMCRKGADFVSNVSSQHPDLERPNADKIRAAPPEAFVGSGSCGRATATQPRMYPCQGDIVDPRVEQRRRDVCIQSAMKNSIHAKAAREMGFADSDIEQALRKQYQTKNRDFNSLDELLEVLDDIKQDSCGAAACSKPEVKEGEKPCVGVYNEQIRSFEIETECKICFDDRADVVFVPCGHLSTCENCARRITCCPICRSYVREKIKTYTS